MEGFLNFGSSFISLMYFFLGDLTTPHVFMAFLSPIVADLSLTKTFSSPIGEILPEKIWAVSATAKKHRGTLRYR